MAWTTEANMVKGREEHGSAGLQNAALAICSRSSDETASKTSESFNGNSWSLEGNPIYEYAWLSGSGQLNSALKISGGAYATDCEEYNGTSWSIISSCNTGRNWHRSNGLSNTTLMCGGEISNGSLTNTSEEYNGTTWNQGGNLDTARYKHGVGGNVNDGIAIGGKNASWEISTEAYDGTSFSYSANLVIGAAYFATSGINTTLNIIISGNGLLNNENTAQYYDGTSWSQIDNLNQGRYACAGSGNGNTALNFGGISFLKTTESYSIGYNLTGQITDIFNNTVSNALVWIENKSDLSDESGNYSITTIPSGQYNITTTHENYFTDIYSINITQNESYNPILYPRDIQFKDILNLSNVIEWNEESNFDMNIEKNINNSIIIDISKKDEITYNFRILALNNSEKEYIYSYAGYKIKTLNINNIYNISNLYIIECSFEKKKGNKSYWVGNLRFLQGI